MAVVEDLAVAPFLRGGAKKLYIGGRWVDATSGKTFQTLDPASGEPLAEIADGDVEDVDLAVAASRKSFDTGAWRNLPAAERSRILWKVGDLIEERMMEFAELESLDNGKPINEALLADVPLAVSTFRYYAGWVTKIAGQTLPVSLPGEYLAYTLREPVGVVGLIIPWNFPLLMAAWKVAPALACGNSVILKPAEQTPLSALLLAEILQEAEVPAGVFNLVTGGAKAGAALTAHADVDKVAFTGSTEVGKKIVQASAGNLKRVSLELGGKSPNIVFADADLSRAASGAFFGIFFNQGPGLLRGQPAAGPGEGVRRHAGPPAQHRRRSAPRTGNRSADDDGAARLRRAAAARHGLHRRRSQRRRRPRHRRQPCRRRLGPWLLRRADHLRPSRRRHEGRARGDLRTSAGRDPLRERRRPDP
jgi:hypothetical protein